MKCLHPTLSHLFVCLPTLELTAFEQQVCLPKISYANALKLETNSRKKRNMATLNTLTVIGLNNIRALYIGSSKSSEPKKFVRRLTKVEGQYIQEQQPN